MPAHVNNQNCSRSHKYRTQVRDHRLISEIKEKSLISAIKIEYWSSLLVINIYSQESIVFVLLIVRIDRYFEFYVCYKPYLDLTYA